MAKVKKRKQSLKARFQRFAKLIEEMAQEPINDKVFISEIESACHCLGLILFQNDPEYSKHCQGVFKSEEEKVADVGQEIEANEGE